MSENQACIGIIGGSGQLGGAIASALLRTRCMAPAPLWIASRSQNDSIYTDASRVRLTTHNQELVDACQIVVISVPPHLLPTVNIDAGNCLIVSVMAGVSIKQIQQQTSARSVVRAMSNPAAEKSLAYSPWCASIEVTDEDRRWTRQLFEACGQTDELQDEEQVGRFTAITGPVPGFVAYYADCMVQYAVRHGIDPAIADRAIRQLFLASGITLAETEASPAEHVRQMIAYAGTTAAGLEAMSSSTLAESIGQGLEAAYQKNLTIS